MALFRKDPAASLVKAKSVLATIEGRLADLDRERGELLLGDDLAPVEKLDGEVERLRRSAARHRDQIVALGVTVRQLEHDRREEQRTAAIAVIAKKMAKRIALAAELTASIKAFGDLYFQLIAETRRVTADFPFPCRFDLGALDERTIQREVAQLLFSAGRPGENDGVSQIQVARFGGSGVAEQYVGPRNLQTIVANHAEATLHELRSIDIAEASADEETDIEEEAA